MIQSLAELTATLHTYEATILDKQDTLSAAVALILRQVDLRVDILFIKRATHPDDPWSGHIAFPGGRKEPSDPNLKRTTERETQEELNIDLTTANYLGRLNDQQGRKMTGSSQLTVSCFVYSEPDMSRSNTNYEIESFFWIPLTTLVDPQFIVEQVYNNTSYPGIRLNPHGLLWGLTHRFVQNLLSTSSTNHYSQR